MPDTFRETIKDRKPRFGVLVGFDRQNGTPLWADISLRTARGIKENQTAFENFLEKHKGIRT